MASVFGSGFGDVLVDAIFGRLPKARNSDPATSHEAATQAPSVNHAQIILDCLADYGPLGKDGIADHTGLSGVQISRRLSELHLLGFIEPTGNTVKSHTKRNEREWSLKKGTQ